MLKMVITDLDGTLANPDGKISAADLDTLKLLGDRHIVRTIATGRSLFSAEKILNKTLPIDFLIFSSGAGVLDWQNYQIIKNANFVGDEIEYIYSYLIELDIDFMLHYAIPDNHKFLYHKNRKDNPDFERRLQIYKPYALLLNDKPELNIASQFVLIIPNRPDILEMVTRDLYDFSVIRTTSPLDKQTLWIEIFPKHVCKSKTAEWLCNRLNIDRISVLSIGNDYNDLDLLEWSGISYIVENAPMTLKQRFNVTKSNHESALKHAVNQIIKQ